MRRLRDTFCTHSRLAQCPRGLGFPYFPKPPEMGPLRFARFDARWLRSPEVVGGLDFPYCQNSPPKLGSCCSFDDETLVPAVDSDAQLLALAEGKGTVRRDLLADVDHASNSRGLCEPAIPFEYHESGRRPPEYDWG